ncbi:MAG: HD domain-containing phosphohydrolase [Candidatus Marinarcus sp.]|uniref:HD domain-containing phosphohydrolase n=1 Tax=Candidatus Marinarcus sp. TaxID=3100987 RepID=UPI003AFFC1CC
MYSNTTIKDKLLSLTVVILTIYIIFHIILVIFANDVKQKWNIYDQNIKSKVLIISKIKSQIGYGGMVHDYKNYLLTKDPIYLEKFQKNYFEFQHLKKEYLQLPYTSEELQYLEVIENSMNYYKEKLSEKLSEKLNITHKVHDDLKALHAIDALENLFEKAAQRISQRLDTTIQYIYYLSIVVVLSLILCSFYLKQFFHNTIILPLHEIEEGLFSFFKFLSNRKYSIEPINIQSNDEFGQMAKSINENIQTASILHDKISTQNIEFEKMIEAYSKNVIASRTDLKGIITYTSDAFVEISGYTKEELLGQPHNIVRHPNMPKESFKDMWETIQAGHVWKGEVQNRKKNGDFYYVAATITPIFDEDNDIIGYSAIRQDITHEKEIFKLNKELDTYKKHLETRVSNATKQIEELMNEIEDTQKEVIFTMGAIGERRSEETGNHVKRVAEYTKLLALYYGMDEKEAEMLRQASPMHDIGKVGIADSILNKPGLYTPEEHKLMQEHTTLGYNMLKSSKRELLKTAAIIAIEHHERWDGKGYPNGLKGEEIHIYGRITALADVFDALGSMRVYKEPWSDEDIFKLFKEEKGKQFEAKLVDIFFEHVDEFIAIREHFCDSKSDISN